MKTGKLVRGCLYVVAVIILLLIIRAGGTPPVSVSAATATEDGYTVERFDVSMTIGANRKIEVVNNVAVKFDYGRRGIIFDLPMESGARYTDIRVLRDGEDVEHFGSMSETESDGSMTVTTYHDILSVWIGDLDGAYLDPSRTYVYTVSYLLTVPALEEDGYLPVDVLGFGWSNVHTVHAEITFPEGLRAVDFYSGGVYTQQDYLGVEERAIRSGNSVEFTIDLNGRSKCGITLDFSFEAGVLGTAPDLLPLWIVLLGLAVLALAFVVKVAFCRQPAMVKPVNFTAPDEMDPLLMGKLVDNSVDSEDLGALVFYLASKDYLTIDLSEDEDDPTLIRTEKEIGDDIPKHCKTFLEGLFAGRKKRVTVSSLNYSFYRTAEAVKAEVKMQAGSFYSARGTVAAVLYGILTVLLLGGFVWLYARMNVVRGYNDFFPFVACIPAYILTAFGALFAAQRVYKWSKLKLILPVLGCGALGFIIGLIFCLFPNALFGFGTKLLTVLFAVLAGAASGFFLCRKKDYSEKLGKILGFKQFIEATERDKVEFMLQENPDLYYKILPYAQVLGVTDAWTDKFKGVDMQAPSYVYYGGRNAVFNVLLWHSISRSMCGSMGRSMVSRPRSGPSSHSGGHGFGGGSGRGFGGGGFGGGGGRSF